MMAQDRPRRILTGEYVMEGHSQCPWCENHIKIKDDPAGGCQKRWPSSPILNIQYGTLKLTISSKAGRVPNH